MRQKLIILGAAGRDFHDFNVYWKHREDVEVCAFTAAQIPDIEGRRYPPALAGPRYPNGIPIHAEADLEHLIESTSANLVAFAYSDVSYEHVMHEAARVQAAGADFILLGPRRTMLYSERPVISICAVRTGCGKSQTTRYLASLLQALGKRVAVIRHPMPYGDLEKQACQRYETLADLDRYQCTIEEREEYEPHIVAGNLCFAGVDYERILREAEASADVILWDGGNNDLPFYVPDLHIVLVDPHRPGHELTYYPGEANLRLAHAVLLNKVDTADPEDVERVRQNVRRVNPDAELVLAASPILMQDAEKVRGRRVLVVEDGPTLTHGGMRYGAGHVAALSHGAIPVDPRPYAVGTIHETFERYGHLEDVLPAMGYGAHQIEELESTIHATPCDFVLIGTPIDLGRVLSIDKPALRVRYDLQEKEPGQLRTLLTHALARNGRTPRVAHSTAWPAR